MISYIIKVHLFWLAFLLLYKILLKKETFFGLNRRYLLASFVIGALIPLIKIPTAAFNSTKEE